MATGARANRIQVEKGRAVGVDYRRGERPYFARVAREVIVSAGAVQSPQLLELSGIGDRQRLAKLGIASVAHLPASARTVATICTRAYLSSARAPSP